MKAYRLIMALCSVLLLKAAAYSQTTRDLIGTWHNQSNAILTIAAISPSGRFTGTFLTKAGVSGRTFPLFGWVNPVAPIPKSDHIIPLIFTVQWAVSGNVTVWAGYLSEEKKGSLAITTIWNVIHANPDPDNPLMHSVAQAAIFRPGAAHVN